MARYIVEVPVKWPVTGSNNFKVEIDAADELTEESMTRIRRLAAEHARSRGLEVLDHGEPQIFRKK